MGDGGELIPGNFSRGPARVFTWVTRRMIRSHFRALRLARESVETAGEIASGAGPTILLLNHASWWDPLMVIGLRSRFFPQRQNAAPMDSVELNRFKFFRRLGIFGIDPDSVRSMELMRNYVADVWRRDPGTVLAITPQGRFTDIREPLRLRPGAAIIAAATEGVRVFALAIEFCFWTDKKPEVLTRIVRVEPGSACPAGAEAPPREGTRRAWLDAMESAMQANADALAELVRRRDSTRFEVIIGGDDSGAHPMYNLWMRLTGRKPSIDATRRRDAETPGP